MSNETKLDWLEGASLVDIRDEVDRLAQQRAFIQDLKTEIRCTHRHNKECQSEN